VSQKVIFVILSDSEESAFGGISTGNTVQVQTKSRFFAYGSE